jgi:polysaccharide export outer membrane protein
VSEDHFVIKRILVTALLAAGGGICQQATGQAAPAQTVPSVILSGNDQLVISARDVEGLTDRLFRIESDGTINLPLVGKVRAEGLTVEQFEKFVTAQLGIYVKSPQVSVTRFANETNTIVVLGAFKNPGVHALPERRTFLEVISSVGGVEPGVRTVRITRRLDGVVKPLPSGVEDVGARVSTLIVNLNHFSENPSIRELLIERDDTLFAGTAGVMFVTGEVQKPGTVEPGERDSLGVMELIAMAGGLTHDAAPEKVTILRPILNGTKRGEIPVDLKGIQEGRSSDFRVMPNDMLFVPRSRGRARTVAKGIVIAVPILTSIIIYTVLR